MAENFLKRALFALPEVRDDQQRQKQNQLSLALQQHQLDSGKRSQSAADRLNQLNTTLKEQAIDTGQRAISEDTVIKVGTTIGDMTPGDIQQNYSSIISTLDQLGVPLDDDDRVSNPQNIQNLYNTARFVRNKKATSVNIPTEIKTHQFYLKEANLKPTGKESPEELAELERRRQSARMALQVQAKAGTLSTSERLAADPATADIVADQEAGKAGKVEGAKLTEQLVMKPKIEAAVAQAKVEAKRKGEAFTTLKQAEAGLPGLLETTDKLKELAPLATHTTAGKVWNFAVKELGFKATKGATARAQFISTINNQVLPLLKPTFGAAFTVAEGDALRATLGDANTTPEEKIAVLNSFIDNKFREIESLNRELSENPVFLNHPVYGEVTMDDIEETLRNNPQMTMKDVVDRIRSTGGQ